VKFYDNDPTFLLNFYHNEPLGSCGEYAGFRQDHFSGNHSLVSRIGLSIKVSGPEVYKIWGDQVIDG